MRINRGTKGGVRHGHWPWLGVIALFCLLIALPSARASDLEIVNDTNDYVDVNAALGLVTVPTLCTADPFTQGQCDALGTAAVLASQGNGPDVYFEPTGSNLEAKNAFVPQNGMNPIGYSGYGPIFSQHKYNLFGRGDEYMGPYTREEHLFFIALMPADGLTNGQTTPGDDMLQRYIRTLLLEPQGATSITLGGLTFQYANLPNYQRITGFNSGQRTTVENTCLLYFSAAICAGLPPEFKADLYMADQGITEAFPDACVAAGHPDSQNTYCFARDNWVDQLVVGYVEAWASLGGSDHFAENFRSQVLFDHNDPTLDFNTLVSVDQRLEQSVELGQAQYEASRQTFQQAFQSLSDQATGTAGVNGLAVGQLVSQDVEGFFFSCMGCDSEDLISSGGASHALSAPPMATVFDDYLTVLQTVPTVKHAAQ